MSEEQGTEEVEETSTTEQETPATEKPSATEVPDGQETVTEKPAESNSEAENVVATPPEKTTEQLIADRAHFQTGMQEAKDELKSYHSESQEQPKTEVTSPSEGKDDDFSGMSRDDINDRLRDDPMLMAQVMTQELDRKAQLRESERDRKLEHSSESTYAKRVLTEFCSKNDVSGEEFDAANQRLRDMKVSASPTAYGQLLVDSINAAKIQSNLDVKSTEAAAKAAQAAKTQVLTIQPGGGAPAASSEPLTQAQIIQNKFKKSASKTVLDKMFN